VRREKSWAGNQMAMEEYCLDLTRMHALLRLGYEFEYLRPVEIGKQIDGTELGLLTPEVPLIINC
jgi:hypothetical protein